MRKVLLDAAQSSGPSLLGQQNCFYATRSSVRSRTRFNSDQIPPVVPQRSVGNRDGKQLNSSQNYLLLCS